MFHDWTALERDLRRFLPQRAVVTKRQELLCYDSDGLTMDRHQPPLAVLPETTDQVAAVLRCCRAVTPVCACRAHTAQRGPVRCASPSRVRMRRTEVPCSPRLSWPSHGKEHGA